MTPLHDAQARLAEVMNQIGTMASHALADPLRQALASLEALPVQGAAKGAVRQCVEQSLTRLQALRDYAWILENQEEPQELDLSSILSKAWEVVEGKNPHTGGRQTLNLSLDETIRLHGRPEQMHRALVELLDNSLRYNRHPHPVVNVSLLRLPGTLVLVISDNGPGIDPDWQPILMEPCQRGEGQPQDEKDHPGMGLTLAQAVMHNHNGWLELPLPGHAERIGCQIRLLFPHSVAQLAYPHVA